VPGGLGVGLPWFGNVELHGAASRLAGGGAGKGSEFTVRIPARPIGPCIDGFSTSVAATSLILLKQFPACRPSNGVTDSFTACHIRFLLLFENWVDADDAIRAECRLRHSLDVHCEGLGPPPTREAIAEARRLREVANERLRAVWKLAREARACVQVT
jgi:hypothetical protein